MSAFWIFMLGMVVLIGSRVYAQDGEGVLNCLGYHELDRLQRGQRRPLTREELVQWYELEGADVWVGYERGGFDVPDDVRRWFKLVDEPTEVWVWYSPSEDAAYIFPFRDATPRLEGEGYAIHPCGAFRVPRDEIP